MLVYKKTMLDRNNCIKSFFQMKNLEKSIEKFIFVLQNGAQKNKGFVDFENACSRAKTYVILTLLKDVYFYGRYC